MIIASATPPETEDVTLRIVLEAPPEQDLFLVGNTPQVGGWNPDQALYFQYDGVNWITDLSLPRGSVVSCKIIRKTASSYQWEEGSNHILWANKNKSIPLQSRL